MNRLVRLALAAGGIILAVPLALMLPEKFAPAADHLDPPTRTDPALDKTPDTPADIADVYVWYTVTKLIVAVTFAGPQSPSLPAVYDRDVLYTLNIGNGIPKSNPTFAINFRFGADTSGSMPQYGVEVTGLPGVDGALVGPVETNLVKDGVIVRAGLFDDPFFFDSQGLKTSRSTGVLSFDKNRNFFVNENLTAVVFEIPRERVTNGSNPLGLWATSARFGGQL